MDYQDTRIERLLGNIQAMVSAYVPEQFRKKTMQEFEELTREIHALQRANAKLIRRIGRMMTEGRMP